jgi:hypothetical protein
MPPIADAVEVRHPVVVTGDRLTVNDTGARAQAEQRLDDKWKPLGQAIAGTAVEPHMVAVLTSYHPKAVVLDLMQPDRPEGGLSAFVGRHGAIKPAGKARCNMPMS